MNTNQRLKSHGPVRLHTQPNMKNSSSFPLGSIFVLLAFGLNSAVAEFASPRIEPDESAARPSSVPRGPASLLTVVNNFDSGPGSLRDAISNAAPGDAIQFALRTPTVIFLNSSLAINKDLQILGPGPDKLTVARTFRRAPSFRVFNVRSGVVTLSGMTISNGRALNVDGVSDNLGGGILNRGTLTVSNCVITRNTAPTENGGVGFGGGIFSLGPVTIVNSTIARNFSSDTGGGICTFHSASFVLEASTVSGNYAAFQAGGVNFQGLTGSIRNSTISGNRTEEDGIGSGLVHIAFQAEASNLSLAACTIARNRGGSNAVVIAALRGNLGSVTRLIGTLVGGNLEPNFSLVGNPLVQSLGHNLDSDGTSGLVNGVNGDIVGTELSRVDVRLGPLAPNGGPTFTHALLTGSPALDAGTTVDAAGNALATDQRGYPRPQGAASDIGAFENQPPTLVCPPNGNVDCGSELMARVNDLDGDALTVVWAVDGVDLQTNFLHGVHPPEPRKVRLNTSLSLGSHTINVRVWDGKSPVVQCSSVVMVQDTKPPRIKKIEANPSQLWPPNNKWVPVTLTVRAEDCGPFRCRIISVRSNQSWRNEPDWVITGDLTLNLRAKRAGNSERIYIVTVECRDANGNASRGFAKIVVPRNQSSGHDGDDCDDRDDRDDEDDQDDRDDRKDRD